MRKEKFVIENLSLYEIMMFAIAVTELSSDGYKTSLTAITACSCCNGANRSLAGHPKGWGAYLRPAAAAAAWQLGHQCETAFSPSPRLKANAFPSNPS